MYILVFITHVSTQMTNLYISCRDNTVESRQIDIFVCAACQMVTLEWIRNAICRLTSDKQFIQFQVKIRLSNLENVACLFKISGSYKPHVNSRETLTNVFSSNNNYKVTYYYYAE